MIATLLAEAILPNWSTVIAATWLEDPTEIAAVVRAASPSVRLAERSPPPVRVLFEYTPT